MIFCKNEIEGIENEGRSNYFGIYTNEQAGTYEDISEAYLQKIKDYTEYKNTMKNMLNIFLSKETKTKGIIKHIKDKGIRNEYELTYYDSMGFSPFDKSRLLLLATNLKSDSNPSQPDRDRLDVYVGLNTFGIMAKVIIVVKNIFFDKVESTETVTQNKITSVVVSIKSWKNIVFDYYDFNKELGFPLPNPHYKTGKIHPEIENVSFKQTHEKLVEMAKSSPPMARPFYIYKEFFEYDPTLLIQNEEITF